MVAEVYAGLSAFKAMFDMAKGLKDINDAAIRNAAIIELQEQILSAQAEQFTLVERVHELEREVAQFKEWETEKQRYELTEVGPGAFARAFKPDTEGAAPLHFICPTCYDQGKKFVLQALSTIEQHGVGDVRICPTCKTRVAFARNRNWTAAT